MLFSKVVILAEGANKTCSAIIDTLLGAIRTTEDVITWLIFGMRQNNLFKSCVNNFGADTNARVVANNFGQEANSVGTGGNGAREKARVEGGRKRLPAQS